MEPLFDLSDLSASLNSFGGFIDFRLRDGSPLITDYSRVEKEIIVIGNEISLYGQHPKCKKEIRSIDELKIKLATFFMIACESTLICIPLMNGWYSANQNFISFKDTMINIVHQVIFDILYDMHLADSPLLNLNQYCEKFIRYEWDPSDDDMEDRIAATYKWMANAIKREASMYDNPIRMERSIVLGQDPEAFAEYLKEFNRPFKDNKSKPKHIWDYIYYNGNRKLITSKQFKRSFNKKTRIIHTMILAIIFTAMIDLSKHVLRQLIMTIKIISSSLWIITT